MMRISVAKRRPKGRSSAAHAALLGFAVAMLAGCATRGVTVPPVTPSATGVSHTGKFVWRDLLTDDVPAVKRFYGELFGWEFDDAQRDGAYTVITYKGRPIGGIVLAERVEADVSRSQWVSYLSVPDVDLAVEYVIANGGAVFVEPRELRERGRIAVVTDPQGALVAFVRADGGDPPDADPAPNEWLWTELWTRDTPRAVSFYETLFGYDHEEIDAGIGRPYHLLRRDGRPRAGVVELPWEEVRPNWLPYVRVEDPSAVVARVEALGGQVIFAPREDMRGGSVALIADPSGAALTIQKWPLEGNER